MINKYSIAPMIPTALLSLMLIGCGGEDKGFLDPVPESSSLTAHPQVFVIKQGETQHIDLTQSVMVQNISDWELANLDDKSGLGAIINENKTSFDYKALTAGAGFINYTVRGQNLTATSQVVLAVNAGTTPSNTLPVAGNINLDTLNNADISIDLRDSISDADGDTLRINNLISASGRFTLDGYQVTFAPEGFVGVDQAVYSIDDGRGGYAMAYIAVISSDANPPVPNSAPVAKDDHRSMDVAKQSLLNLDLSTLMSDADGDSLKVVTLYSSNERAKITGTKVVTYTPGNFRGVDQFTYLITDSKGGYDLGTITVSVSDSTPPPPAEPSLAAYPQTLTLELGQSQAVDLSKSVASANINSWTLTQVQDNSGLGIVTSKTASTFNYLAQSAGVANIGYTVQGGGLTATSEIIAVINAPLIPENTPPNANNVILDTLNNRAVTADLQEYISDDDGDTLNIAQLFSASGRFTLSGLQVTFAPNGFVGIDQAVYSVEDGKGGYALGYIIATSVDANPPVQNAIPTAKNLEKVIDVATLPVLNFDLAALGLIADADGDALTIANIYTADNRAVKQGDTGIRYSPGAFRGVDQFTYVITDGKDGFAIGTITIVVNDSTPENLIPTAKPIEHHFTLGNSALTFSIKNYVHDADGDTVRLIDVVGASGNASVNSDEYIRYQPNGFIGTDRFAYIVTDDKGGYAMATATIHVPDPNPTAPIAGTAQIETTPDTPVTIDLSTVISDNETPTALLTIASVSNATSPATATLAGKKVTYTPNSFIGNDILTYVVSDGLHQTMGTIVVTVAPYGAHEITAEDITVTTDAGTTVTIDVTSKISTTDPTAGTLSVVHAVGAALGDVTITGNVLTYTPKVGAYGKDAFVYIVKDSHEPAHYAQGSITVDVTPPLAPEITKLEAKLEEVNAPARITGMQLVADVTCARCDINKYQYAWIINGLTVGSDDFYELADTDIGFNIRLEVTGEDMYGQAAPMQYATYNFNSVIEIIGNTNAFAALKSDGTVVTWGDPNYGGSSSTVQQELVKVKSITANNTSFAALKSDGTVITWGLGQSGGDSSAVNSYLRGIKKIYSSYASFAALNDNDVITWGFNVPNGSQNLKVKDVAATYHAYAALLEDGTVSAWGDAGLGGDISQISGLLTNVNEIVGNRGAFAALKSDGTVITWGSNLTGGDSTAVKSELYNIKKIYANSLGGSFAALKMNGDIISWGSFQAGDQIYRIPAASSSVKHIYSNSVAFTALYNDGTVKTWGEYSDHTADNGVSARVNNVKNIYAASQAFAALDNDGNVQTWGNPDFGGDSSHIAPLLKDIHSVYATTGAFAAIDNAGSIIAWGNSQYGGDMNSIPNYFSAKNIYSNGASFAAMIENGKVITWGYPAWGGDSSSVSKSLETQVIKLESSIK